MQSDVEAAQGISSDDIFQMDIFWVQVKQIKETNQIIRSKTEQLSKLHAQTLESIQVEEKAVLSKQTEQLTDQITQLANQNRALLKTISTENKKICAQVGSTEPTMRMRTNQVSPY
jgi:t-SNARE complex subunit (syntaxin)